MSETSIHCGTSRRTDGARTFLAAPGANHPSQSDTNVRASRTARFWSVLAVVAVAETVAILAFYGLEWSWLRQMHVLWLQATLQALGCTVQTGSYSLTVNGHPFQVSSFCTYVDLIICGLPLLWRVQRRWSTNLAVLATYAVAVAVVNLARVLYGVYAFSHGVSLFWSHDLVDYVLWYPTIAVVALLWMRSLTALWSAPAERSGDGALGCGGVLDNTGPSRNRSADILVGFDELRSTSSGQERSRSVAACGQGKEVSTP